MVEVDLNVVLKELTKAVRCMVVVRKLAQEIGKDCEELAELERGFREAAGQLQNAQSAIGRGKKVVLASH